jgi:MscS family membrane protein
VINFEQIFNFFSKYHDHENLMSVVFEISIVLFITAITSYCTERLLNRLQSRYKRTATNWDNAIVASIKKPVHFIIWVLGITHCLELANFILKLEVLKNISIFRDVSIVFAISWFLLGLVAQLELKWNHSVEKKSSKLDKTTVGAITKLLKVTTFIIATLMILETLGFSISGILAFGSISGAGVSFAAKDLLANFFGALMIYLDKPFKEGDWIKIDAKGIEGVVEKIGLRCTIIHTMDKRPLYVPNSIFAVAAIENPSRMSHRRIKEIIGIRHEDIKVVNKITQDIEKALKNNPLIDHRQPVVVYLEEFSESSLNILLYSYTKSVDLTQFAQVKHNIMLNIAKIIAKHNAKIATVSTGCSAYSSANNGNTDAAEEEHS